MTANIVFSTVSYGWLIACILALQFMGFFTFIIVLASEYLKSRRASPFIARLDWEATRIKKHG